MRVNGYQNQDWRVGQSQGPNRQQGYRPQAEQTPATQLVQESVQTRRVADDPEQRQAFARLFAIAPELSRRSWEALSSYVTTSGFKAMTPTNSVELVGVDTYA